MSPAEQASAERMTTRSFAESVGSMLPVSTTEVPNPKGMGSAFRMTRRALREYTLPPRNTLRSTIKRMRQTDRPVFLFFFS